MNSPAGEPDGGPVPSGSGPGSQDAQRSLLMALTLPVVVLAAAVLGPVFGVRGHPAGWSSWARLVLLVLVVVAPSAIGALLGRRAARLGSTAGRAGLALNLVLGLLLAVATAGGVLLQPGGP